MHTAGATLACSRCGQVGALASQITLAVVTRALTDIEQRQLEFWTAFLKSVADSTFAARKPAAKNWYYLPLGAGSANIVLTMLLEDGRLDCKLDLRPTDSPERAAATFNRLQQDRAAIEAELGYTDLRWGKPTPTRIYRSRHANINDQRAWPEAFDWLLSSAESFKRVFGPRIHHPDARHPRGVKARPAASNVRNDARAPTPPAATCGHSNRHRGGPELDRQASPRPRAHDHRAVRAAGQRVRLRALRR